MPVQPTSSSSGALPIAPGAHILVRDAVWRVQQVNTTSGGGKAWHVVGVDEIVQDQEAVFLEAYEPEVRVLDPADTALEVDTSPGHRDGLLFMESLLREVPPTGPELHVGHRAAMDVLDFQLDPARTALARPRQRILIADAVGLGKTLEAGILLSELVRRGRGKRILVVTVKSMLTQFQKELWCRFSIPLVRLDSQGLHRIRERIPTNHNPFHHYDRAIISIDTLKQDNAFRAHLEQAHWDVIVIDEAHNVAARGGGRSLRAKVAELLATRSDALILLSATPHDGKARSFASLMNMLDPTAIANPDDYTRDDIEGLFVRRFKKDVADQIAQSFPERTIAQAHAQASAREEAAYDALVRLRLDALDTGRGNAMLLKTGLAKALFSSPAACAAQLLAPLRRERVRAHLPEGFAVSQREGGASVASTLGAAAAHLPEDLAGDLQQLSALAAAVEAIGAGDFSKYGRLVQLITDPKRGFGWSARRTEDRLVIFSERIETLRFLSDHLRRDLGLKDDQLALLHGGLSDTEQQQIVDDFGNRSAPVRLLLASDVASEGLNLHYLCHRLIHFDVPWSLMLFQQRNGRIDRYGQTQVPQIVYLLTRTHNTAVAGDHRILELLIERDEQAVKNINQPGDPSALMGVYDIDAEERFTARLMEEGLSPDEASARLGGEEVPDLLDLILGAHGAPPQAPPQPRELLSLYPSDFAFVAASLDRLAEVEGLQRSVRGEVIELSLPPDTEASRRQRAPGLDLRRRFRKLPDEVLPDDGVVVLTPDKDAIQRATVQARGEATSWPRVQYLWPLNPVVGWCQSKGRAAFGRHTAPVITLVDGLQDDEAVVVVSGLIPNRRSQPLVHRWFGVRFLPGRAAEVLDFGDLARSLKLGRAPLPNRGAPCELGALTALIPPAVEATRQVMRGHQRAFEDEVNPKLQAELDRLEVLRERQLAQLDADYGDLPAHHARRHARERRIQRIFDDYLDWVQDVMTSEPVPFLQVIAVLRSERGFGGAA